ncbi:MAG: hypothetical protein FWF83_08370 [Clostridiales bacterium]|nr:hypothetical protein [Clostridiales bacterium]
MNDKDLNVYIIILTILIIGICAFLGILLFNASIESGLDKEADLGGTGPATYTIGYAELTGDWHYQDETWQIRVTFGDDDRITILLADNDGTEIADDGEYGAMYSGGYALDSAAIQVSEMDGYIENLAVPPTFLSDGDHTYAIQYHGDTGVLDIRFTDDSDYLSFSK